MDADRGRGAARSAEAAAVTLALATSDDHDPAPYFVEQVRQALLANPAFGATTPTGAHALYRAAPITNDARSDRAAGSRRAARKCSLDRAHDPAARSCRSSRAPVTSSRTSAVGTTTAPSRTSQLGPREPGGAPTGSTFKPFVLAAALEQHIPLVGVPRHAGRSSRCIRPATRRGRSQLRRRGLRQARQPRRRDRQLGEHRVRAAHASTSGPSTRCRSRNDGRASRRHSPVLERTYSATTRCTALDIASAYTRFAADGVRTATRCSSPRCPTERRRRLPRSHVAPRVLDADIAANRQPGTPAGGDRGHGHTRPHRPSGRRKDRYGDELEDAWFVGRHRS